MKTKNIYIILLVILIVTSALTIINTFTEEKTPEMKNGTLKINNESVKYDACGKCIDVIDGNTIQVYGVGKVQLTQIKINDTEFSKAKNFVSEKCLGKTVYLNIDDKQPKDKYGRTLAIVYTNETDINQGLINNNLAKISYFTPSEFKKGEI